MPASSLFLLNSAPNFSYTLILYIHGAIMKLQRGETLHKGVRYQPILSRVTFECAQAQPTKTPFRSEACEFIGVCYGNWQDRSETLRYVTKGRRCRMAQSMYPYLKGLLELGE